MTINDIKNSKLNPILQNNFILYRAVIMTNIREELQFFFKSFNN